MTAWKLTDDELLRDLAIAEASEIFLETRKPFLSPRTVKDYQYCRKWLADYFGAKTLREITALDIQRFQAERAKQDGPYKSHDQLATADSQTRWTLGAGRAWL